MGTRSTITFYENEQPLVCIYQQYDGYITGVGHELANFLKGKTILNGFNKQTMDEGFANGMGCLAAQFIRQGKTKIGAFYITSIGESEDYNYHVKLVGDVLHISVDDFDGTPEQLLQYEEV